MQIVTVGDVGVRDDMIHIGDEAMFEALVTELGSRGVEVVGVSSEPAETAVRYGIDTVPRIGFDLSLGRPAADERLGRVIRAATGESTLADDDPALTVIDAVRSSSGVAVAGGGNLASTWPVHIYERRALVGIATALGLPSAVSGQTFGPELTGTDVDLVAELLGESRVVGAREDASAALAARLGVPADRLQRTVDDASFLVDDAAADSGYLLVSLSTHLAGRDRPAFVAALASVLDRVAHDTGLEVRFHAHWAALDPSSVRGDSILHDEVRQAMKAGSEVVPTVDSAHAARLARGAGLLVTGRYHPAVFAVPAGVPTIGISTDSYTVVKLTGALGGFGQSSVLGIDALIAGDGHGLAAQVWRDRATIREDGIIRSISHRDASAAWWDRVAAQF
ncbi:polysaccharide pyruvyl transferase family protein [Amnibacterium flavum]|uniref:polysaccharide pyruvyl transferase family protein n=1 Tax=Amnibacterium flavum TaxID=2173173 RepID=UPI0014040CB4|nr:polysaccharide pyruvyl transferase family protein [Amnibacterium flavum]